MSTNHPPRRPPRPSFPSSSIHGAIYTRVLSPANTPPVGNKRKPRWKNLTNPGESLSTDYPLPESIIPKGYFLVLVPSKSPLICPHPLDPLRSLLSVRSPFATDEERKRREESGGKAYRFHRHSVGRCSFRPRGVKITGGSGGKNATRESSIVLDGRGGVSAELTISVVIRWVEGGTHIYFIYIHIYTREEEEEEEEGFRIVKALTLERLSFSRSPAHMRAGYSLSGPFSAA